MIRSNALLALLSALLILTLCEDKEWLMDAFQRLRDFYSSAATQRRAIIMSLV